MQYVLASRDLIAGSIETMVRAHNFDGLVFLCACDKIVPAMLMAAASLDLPSLFLTPGSMLPYEENGITYATPDLKESIGAYRAGKSMKRLSPVSARISVHPAVPAPCTARQIPWPSLRKLLVLPLWVGDNALLRLPEGKNRPVMWENGVVTLTREKITARAFLTKNPLKTVSSTRRQRAVPATLPSTSWPLPPSPSSPYLGRIR